MKNQFVLGMLMAGLLVLGNSSASLVTAQAPAGSHLRLLSSDKQAIVLELTVADFQVETIAYEGQTFQRLIIPETVQTETPGEPQLPTRGTLLGLPSAEGVSIQVLEADYDVLTGYRLYPAPGLEATGDSLDGPLSGGIQQTFVLNQELYATDAFYPAIPVGIDHTGAMRGHAVAQVQFYPVQYNPVSGEVRLYRRILAQITWETPLSIDTAETRRASPAYENLLRKTLLNYDALERPPVFGQSPPIGASGIDGIGTSSITPTLKIGVTEDDLYELSPSDLTDAGFDLNGVALNTIKISNRGAEIPIYAHDANDNNAFDGSDYILFYGTAVTDSYTTQNVYWLEAGGDSGKRMDTRDGTLSGSAAEPSHFPVTLHAEEDTYYWQTMPNGEGEDHWFWGGRLTAPGSRDYSLTLKNVSATATTATIRVRLKGRTSTGTFPDHHTQIQLNAVNIDDQAWDGQITFDHEATVPHSDLISGNDTLTITIKAVGDTGAPVDQLFVNWIEIDYWDTYASENDELLFGAPEAGTFQFEVTGFSSDDVVVFDVTDPANVAAISDTTVVSDGDSYKLQFEDAAQPETRYLAVALTVEQRKSPASIKLDQPSSWKSNDNGADYVIITHEDFHTSALALANHRTNFSGYRVATVKIEDIYDEFNHGIFNPQAIQDFLAYAHQEWVEPEPTYVLLVGGASYDYRDLLNLSRDNYIPTHMIETDLLGQTPSDNWFVLLDGEDAWPDMFIGRLTAQSISEASDMVDKVIDYEQNPPDASWNTKALLVADDAESAFEITSEQLAARLPYYYTVDKVYADDYPPGDPTTAIASQINAGSLLVNYTGHGAVDRWGEWSGGDIFNRSPDVTALNNMDKLPVVTIANCLNGFFVGTKTSMAEEFLRLKDKGAVAVWAATSLDYPSGHRVLMSEFYDAIFQDDLYALGEATTVAKITTDAQNPSGTWSALVETFVLFGDPAMKLGLPTNYPYLENTTPVNGASDVPLDQNLQIVFSKPMSPTTVLLGGPGTTGLGLSPTWSEGNTVLSYAHTDFGDGETLAFTIEGQDSLGNPLGTGPVPSTWSFATIALKPGDVTISGPTTGITQTTYTFSAGVNPVTAMQPVTYTWQATGQSPTTHTDSGLSDSMSFTWNAAGTQAITVTATNDYGSATDTHVVTINDGGTTLVFLPIIIKND